MTERISSRTMHIGELAERTGLSLRTIRHYDEVGLLPATGRTEGGFRVYAENDVERLTLIKQMKPLGFSLEEMAEILDILSALESGAAEGAGREKLAEFMERAKSQRAKIARNLSQADEFIERMGKNS
ncbi:DNA-binding transcriptional MerR regulator [Pseudarthrobacter oxydans]|uniref:DNA-binding transcriptional MerR regulator n=2 Tax=Pseudarthrobacter TaxID=1742993 RepID=A0ABT9S0K5_9MICC|nr:MULTISPECIES: MerR family transcriptional regulator [Micrococcaceae]MCU1516505.1 MerR family transcriptional regulator [Pseudarthrobacter sp.]MDP9890069.1 DNA-binding transcriptional MerR regulator [Pseudarthrobacter enclensis]MDP9988823.1 DNA-binding transcriptional MerR regulator [Arthrobacter oryzae]MDR7166111.1 DNA-binding transcriptional MerR regulator [Pseudarthrobacter oxydans]NSX36511.1 MerR family transcriptional regulator [Pseudarthrobacter oxydans]